MQDPPAVHGTPELLVGEWEVRPSECRITRDGTVVHLRPKAMDVLVLLARQPGRVVSKTEILDRVWRRRFVTETVLTRAVFEIRAAFGDDTGRPRYVETIVKRGYRLLAPVVRRPEPGGGAAGVDDGGTPCHLLFGSRWIPLGAGEHVIGRDPEALVRIDSRAVSRRHARITVAFGTATIEDLGSKNGTFVQTRRVEAPTELRSGDEIVVAGVALTYRVSGIHGTTVTGSAGTAARGSR